MLLIYGARSLQHTRLSLADWQKHVSKQEYLSEMHKNKEKQKLRAPTNRIKHNWEEQRCFQWENKLEFRTRQRRKKLQNVFFIFFFSFHKFSQALLSTDWTCCLIEYANTQ